MKKYYTLFLVSLSLLACKKNNEDQKDEQKTPNWEIVKNFPQDKSYASANLTVYGGKVFVNTYGHLSLTGVSSNEFKGSLYFQKADDWFVNQLPNQGVMALKEFNGELYGIRANIVKRTIVPVSLNYEYSYTLFKWENNDYKDIATLEYTVPGHGFEKADIQDFILWELNKKLYVISSLGYLWPIESNQFGAMQELHPFSSGSIVGISDKEVTLTQQRTINRPADDGTIIAVKGHYFNGTQVNAGKEYEFLSLYRHQTGEELGNMDAAYQAMNGHLWGIGHQGNKLKNYDTGEVIGGVSDGKKMVGNPIIRNKGKLYIPLEDANLKCAGLVVFDGKTLKELPFVLPEILESCPKLIDATEYNGTTYLLLENKKQYVVVKNI